ncbi:protein HOMOLOG OF MAMMALIAN LYST-INTERACTING PROTEIN 5-like [Vitis riparia]|uniref:protein HOMOLOG OF MAMMALIAN LYST-INTERACTING PROTEIN 5-like n=1 Tax=Vitis riparia TaxID=96939 RepID=UPI00155A48DD|nr:protein HOMOLOG OF MAMMALIAN LYST-INTERACTING PROTEIN 5-like [Vitis riparia]
MASENEPAKLLLPYLQRADELQKHEPLVAYYCRLYAMERGLKIPQGERTKTTNSLLISLMKQLEKDKKALNLGPDDHLHLEGFASNVFARADKQDRAGRADLNTAKTFYAASIFFEILNQFGELQPDLEQKQKYAAWKAADIRKALKEGRKPQPGPPVDENDLSLPSSTTSGAYDLGPSQTGPSFNPGPESDPSPQFNGSLSRQHSLNITPSPPPTNITPSPPPTNITPSPPPTSFPPLPPNVPPPPSYRGADYPSHDFHPPPPTNRSENSSYPQPYHHQPYPQEPQQQLPQNCPSHETPSSYSYPNFQSYPSFTESSLPAAPSHYPSYYQGSDASYSPQSAPVSSYPSAAQYNSSGGNEAISEPAPTSSQTYQYDSNYQPPAEKIAEAHKAARFAVGALAFDDVSVAVDFLKKSLELLTKPSADQ